MWLPSKRATCPTPQMAFQSLGVCQTILECLWPPGTLAGASSTPLPLGRPARN
ncbi:hypothetical protein HaLaN_20150, partial [Haematococcus lacustris]